MSTGPSNDRPTVYSSEDDAVQSRSCPESRFGSQPVAHLRLELGEIIGRGGMGVVYRATDRDLGRCVAVKMLRPELVGTALERRFFREARVTARLRHPAIPAVHAQGTTRDGTPFLILRLIEGDTLKQLLRRRSGPSSNAGKFLSIFESLCHAVGFAHRNGVIHRDLKPANVMVGAHGETQVMDWGLAKVLNDDDGSAIGCGDVDSSPWKGDESTAGVEGTETRAGEVMGTLAYMAPEQARGDIDRISAGTDVFALGAILCELLTGEPPFGRDSTDRVLARVRAGDLTYCQHLLDESVADPDLIALCRECLSPDAADRPRDARVVAERIAAIREQAENRARQAELEREKVQVRLAEQRKRRRQLTLIATALITVLSVGVVGTTTGFLRARAMRAQAERHAIEAEAERDAKMAALRAERKIRSEAIAALRLATSRMIEDQLAKSPRISETERAFLEQILAHHRRLAELGGDDREGQSIRAEGLMRVGQIQYRLGQLEEAETSWRQALAEYRRLADRFPADVETERQLAGIGWQLAVLMIMVNRPDESRRYFDEAREISARLANRPSAEPRDRRQYARLLNSFGLWLRGQGQEDRAEDVFRRSMRCLEQAVPHTDDSADHDHLAATLLNLGSLLRDTGRSGEAEHCYRRAIEIREMLTRDSSVPPSARDALTQLRMNLGHLLRSTGRAEQAESVYRQGLVEQQTLVETYPAVPEYRKRLGDFHLNLAIICAGRDLRLAAQALEEAVEIFERLCREVPNVADYASRLSHSLYNLGVVQMQLAPDDAPATLERAREILVPLVERFPDNDGFRRRLDSTVELLAQFEPDMPTVSDDDSDNTASTEVARKR